MAQTVHLTLRIDGNDIQGESTASSMEREGTITWTHEIGGAMHKDSWKGERTRRAAKRGKERNT